MDFSDEEFRVRFRLGKDTVIAILSEIENDLSYPSGEKNNSVSPLNQLLIALRFYATSTFQVDNQLVYSRRQHVKWIIQTMVKLLYNSRVSIIILICHS